MQGYEAFSIYGFRFDYPSNWKIELDPKSERRKGNVVLKSPEGIHTFISWGSLERAKGKYSSVEDQASSSLEKIKKTRNIEDVEVIKSRSVKVNSHLAKFTHIKLVATRPRLFPLAKPERNEQESRSLHLHCAESDRYFVIYELLSAEKSSEYEEAFMNVVKSFQCHEIEAKA